MRLNRHESITWTIQSASSSQTCFSSTGSRLEPEVNLSHRNNYCYRSSNGSETISSRWFDRGRGCFCFGIAPVWELGGLGFDSWWAGFEYGGGGGWWWWLCVDVLWCVVVVVVDAVVAAVVVAEADGLPFVARLVWLWFAVVDPEVVKARAAPLTTRSVS